MKIFFIFITITFMFIGLSSCSSSKKISDSNPVYFDKNNMDLSVKPGDNFFLYANGNAIKNTVIPADKSRWGNFEMLAESNLNNLKTILENASKSSKSIGSTEQKLGDYYESGMDSTALEAKGASPLLPVLSQIDAVKDYKELMNLVAKLSADGERTFIRFYIGADEKNSSQNILNLLQSGLSLPEKGYYTRTDSATAHARKVLVNYVSDLFSLTGVEKNIAEKNGQTVLNLETELAQFNRTPVQLRDPQSNYNKYSVALLQEEQPNINWQNFFSKLGLQVDSVNLGQPEYYKALNNLLNTISIDDWKTKLKFDYIKNNAGLLIDAFVDANFQFSRTFSGQQKDAERWKKITNRINAGLGDLLGELYVKNYFPPQAKVRMDELVNNLQKAFQTRILNLDWMSDSTKETAILKLNSFLKKIGYPDKWKNYDDVVITKNDFFSNSKIVQKHQVQEMLNKLGKPVDRTEWMMTTPTVNAYYNPTNNEIVFPAGILQFPFFDANADDAINYGGIGAVIGHEMTHGFDDQGSQYDYKGNLQNWWTKSDREKFENKTKVVVNQYNAFTVLDSLHVNGSLTLGENLADIGGIAIAYDAFKMTKQGQGNEKIDGLTPDQRFFLSYAQIWRSKSRDAYLQSSIKTNPHSPENFRVLGTLFNFQPFYEAFNISEGDKMFIPKEDRAKIW